jgi:hypothetical protein
MWLPAENSWHTHMMQSERAVYFFILFLTSAWSHACSERLRSWLAGLSAHDVPVAHTVQQRQAVQLMKSDPGFRSVSQKKPWFLLPMHQRCKR